MNYRHSFIKNKRVMLIVIIVIDVILIITNITVY